MWVPLSFGNPEIEKNHPRHFWPGARYVDWVGTTWYSHYRSSSAFHTFYSNRHVALEAVRLRRVGRLGTPTCPSFVGQFFGFLKSHPRVRMAVYYQSASLKPEFALVQPSRQPRGAAARGQVAAADGRGALSAAPGRSTSTSPGACSSSQATSRRLKPSLRAGRGGDDDPVVALVRRSARAARGGRCGRARCARRRARPRGAARCSIASSSGSAVSHWRGSGASSGRCMRHGAR